MNHRTVRDTKYGTERGWKKSEHALKVDSSVVVHIKLDAVVVLYVEREELGS